MTDSGTTNSLADSATRTNTAKAALYGTGPLVFDGSGSLSVTGSYKHGIWGSDYIHVLEGTISVAVSAKNAIQIVNKFVFDNGALTIDATGTTVGDESKGIKVDGDESSDGAGLGYIIINDGTIAITSVGKAITANWDIRVSRRSPTL